MWALSDREAEWLLAGNHIPLQGTTAPCVASGPPIYGTTFTVSRGQVNVT